MRTRSRGTIVDETETYLRLGYLSNVIVNEYGFTIQYGLRGVGSSVPQTTLISKVANSETITDELVFRKRTGYVYHVKRLLLQMSSLPHVETNARRRILPTPDTLYQTYPQTVNTPSRRAANGVRNEYRKVGASWRVESANVAFTDYDGSLDSQLVRKAMAAITDLNLAISLIEARELPQLFRMLVDRKKLFLLVTRAPEYARAVAAIIRSFPKYGRNLARISRVLNSQLKGRVLAAFKAIWKENSAITLGWCFGIQPTVNDLLSIRKELPKIIRQESLIKGRTVGVSRTETAVPAIRNMGSVGLATSAVALLTDTKTTIRSCHIQHKFADDVSAGARELQAKIDSILGPSALGTAWAVFPLSFAVDWVLGVDTFLDSLFLANSNKYNIDWRWSIKRTVRVDASFNARTGVLPSIGSDPLSPRLYEYSPGYVSDKVEAFKRVPTSAPTVLPSLQRPRDTLKRLYLATLIACGLRRR